MDHIIHFYTLDFRWKKLIEKKLIEKIKNIVITATILTVILSLMLGQIFIKDESISLAERRKLALFPTISFEEIINTKFMSKFEVYLADHFPFREGFRQIKSNFSLSLLHKKELEGIYKVEDHLSKLEFPLNEEQVLIGAKKFNEIYAQYLKGLKVYYAVIPDKNYFLAEQNGYPSMDYMLLKSLLNEHIQNMTEIELFDCLEIDDYYKTDPHWKQDKLEKVLLRLQEKMSFTSTPFSAYDKLIFAPFNGAYIGQSALNIPSEAIMYMIDDIIAKATVFNVEQSETTDVYTPRANTTLDGYSIFLNGAAALEIIENSNSKSGKELIIFRDSFASSLTPLLIGAYDKITLVDLRYMPSDLLNEYITFDEQDVLFLYSTLVLNNSSMLR